MDLVRDGIPAEFVGRAVDRSALHAAAGHPHREAVGVMVAAVVVPFRGRRPSELAAPDHERLLEEPARLQVLKESGDRKIRRAAGGAQAGPELPRMMVPRVAAVEDLDKADAPLHQAAGHQALPAIGRGAGFVESIQSLNRFRLGRDVEGLGRFGLHPERELKGRDARVEPTVGLRVLAPESVQAPEQVELRAAALRRHHRRSQVADGVLEIGHPGPLVRRGKEARSPQGRPRGRGVRADHDEARQVPVLGAQAVEQPGPEAGPREDGLPRVHLERGRRVAIAVRHHRADHAKVVDRGRGVGQELAHLDPAPPVLAELERGAQEISGMGDLAVERLLERQRLPLFRPKARLGIEEVDVRRTSVHEQQDHPLRRRGPVADPRREGIRRERVFLRERVGQQARQGRHAESSAAAAQHLSPGEAVHQGPPSRRT